MEKLEFPVIRKPVSLEPRTLSMEEYLWFVTFNLKYAVKKKKYRRIKKIGGVKEPFHIRGDEEASTAKKSRKKILERIVPLGEAGRSFDIKFWQSQSPAARFLAAWVLLKDAHRLKRIKIDAHTFRLQRTVESLKQK